MERTLGFAAIILLMSVLGILIMTNVSQPIPALVVVALFATGALGIIRKHRALTWAGAAAVWAFYVPVLLALFQVSIGMALVYGGLVALFYGVWGPLLSSEVTAWLVRGRVAEPQLFQLAAPVFIILGLAIFVAGLSQIVRSKIHGGGLVTSGLYSQLRHPQYLGASITALGFVFYGLRPIDFIAWINLIFLHALLAEREEIKLKEKFGSKYLEYRQRVPALLPFIPHWIRVSLSRLLPLGRGRKFALIAIYLLVITVLIAILRVAWLANGAVLLR
ncbi:MAG: methyltransferase family protein [Candidatus Hadarchaeaceae archaeon]